MAENLTVAASRFAIKTEIILFLDLEQPDWVMQIRLQPDQAEVDPLWQAIPLRHINHQVRFRGSKITDARSTPWKRDVGVKLRHWANWVAGHNLDRRRSGNPG